MKVRIDNKTYPSRKAAKEEMMRAIFACDGSEQDRMSFALCAVINGYTEIDTYNEKVS